MSEENTHNKDKEIKEETHEEIKREDNAQQQEETQESKETQPNITIDKVERIMKSWVPKTELGRKVYRREITSIEEVFEKGYIIREPEIVDILLPDLEDEIILIGGTPGKGGGIKRIPVKTTARMHKSGRKRSLHAMVVVGNKNGYVGYGYAKGNDAREAIEKASRKARLNIISIRRGCGSWECNCHQPHSLPFKVTGKSGSVKVELIPGPRGLGIVASSEPKKVLRLAGIQDVWLRSFGNTRTRINFIYALFDALNNLNKIRANEAVIKETGVIEGLSK